MKLLTIAAASLAGVLAFSSAGSAATVDTVDASSAQAGTFFVPTVGQELDSPYYRGNGGGWGWQHGAIASGFTSAILNVSAYDVDEAPCSRSACEVDTIEAYDAAADVWVNLGALMGDDDAFSFTEFNVYSAAGGALIDDIEAGLQVRMEIDVLAAGWFVSLAKSSITTDGAAPPPPTPSIPLPAGAWLLLGGMGALGALRARRRA